MNYCSLHLFYSCLELEFGVLTFFHALYLYESKTTFSINCIKKNVCTFHTLFYNNKRYFHFYHLFFVVPHVYKSFWHQKYIKSIRTYGLCVAKKCHK